MDEERSLRELRVRNHYDAPVELSRAFLDPHLHYSTGFFPEGTESLEEAQAVKTARYTAAMGIHDGGVYLDVGSGWGALCVAWGAVPGVEVSGLTLSPRQAAYATMRAERAEVADRVHFEVTALLDRPMEPAHYDAISFIGSVVHMKERMRCGGRCTLDSGLMAAWWSRRPIARMRRVPDWLTGGPDSSWKTSSG